jgi:glycolate oxidase FAD binding subunit
VSIDATIGHLAATVRDASSVVVVGGRTQWEVGGAVDPDATEVSAPAGIVEHEPRDLTVTVAAATTVADLTGVLAEHRQECPLDPRDGAATVGGVLAAGLSGHRRLRHGPVRDRVLEVRFVTPDGRVVKGGGPTVKNVTGFDIPRLMVGSLGTLGVLVQVTLRCQPRPPVSRWYTADLDPFEVPRRTYRPSCVAWDGHRTWLLLEGVEADVDAEAASVAATAVERGPVFPTGPHRARVSVRPGALAELAGVLDRSGARWLAEVGVGTVHVAADAEDALAVARRGAEAAGGWLLREAGAPHLDPFGRPSPNRALMERIRAAFDPTAKLGRGRLDSLLTGPDPELEHARG